MTTKETVRLLMQIKGNNILTEGIKLRLRRPTKKNVDFVISQLKSLEKGHEGTMLKMLGEEVYDKIIAL